MCFTEKKTRFGFQKAFFQKVHLEKEESSYIRVNTVVKITLFYLNIF